MYIFISVTLDIYKCDYLKLSLYIGRYVCKGSGIRGEKMLKRKREEYKKKVDLRVEYLKNSIKELKIIVEKNINDVS